MFIVVKRKQIFVVTILAFVFIACAVCLNFVDLDQTVFSKTARKLPVYSVDRGEEKVLAISFDAAWGADKTCEIVDILKENNAKATFFLVGFWIDAYKEQVAYIADNGMEIGNHSKTHPHMTKMDKTEMNNEIEYVNHSVKNLTGKTPIFFRAPFGDYDNSVIETINNCNMIPIQWDVDSLDWKGISANEIVNRVVSKAKNGSIILCHNNSDHILEALPIILSTLTDKGFKFVTMSELVYKDYYTIDAQGVQHSELTGGIL